MSYDFFEMSCEIGKVSFGRPSFWSFFSFLELMREHLDSIVCLEMPIETEKVVLLIPMFLSFFSFLELMREHLGSSVCLEMFNTETGKVS